MALRETTAVDTQNELATTRNRIRDDEQKDIDTRVRNLVKSYDEAGQPDNGVPNTRFDVNDKADGKRRVNRAFSLVTSERIKKAKDDAKPAEVPTADLPAKLGPRWFKDGEPDSEGWLTLKFGVRQVMPDEKAEDGAENGEASTDPTPAAGSPESGDGNPSADESPKPGRFSRR